jgi:CHASE3 domain sensor protein
MLHDITQSVSGEFVVAVICLVMALTLLVIGIKDYRQQQRRERRRRQSEIIRNLNQL